MSPNLIHSFNYAIPPKVLNNFSEKGHGLFQMTFIKHILNWQFLKLKHISKTNKAKDFKFGTQFHLGHSAKLANNFP